jgi:hypothetical protein
MSKKIISESCHTFLRLDHVLIELGINIRKDEDLDEIFKDFKIEDLGVGLFVDSRQLTPAVKAKILLKYK